MIDEDVEWNFQKSFGKFFFSPLKMKFAIHVEKDRQIFSSVQQASEKTGIPSKHIAQVLQSGGGRYFS